MTTRCRVLPSTQLNISFLLAPVVETERVNMLKGALSGSHAAQIEFSKWRHHVPCTSQWIPFSCHNGSTSCTSAKCSACLSFTL